MAGRRDGKRQGIERQKPYLCAFLSLEGHRNGFGGRGNEGGKLLLCGLGYMCVRRDERRFTEARATCRSCVLLKVCTAGGMGVRAGREGRKPELLFLSIYVGALV